MALGQKNREEQGRTGKNREAQGRTGKNREERGVDKFLDFPLMFRT